MISLVEQYILPNVVATKGQCNTELHHMHAYEKMVAEAYERGKALNTASLFEIDDVIDPADTRVQIIKALEMLQNKRDSLPAKKHGNIPL